MYVYLLLAISYILNFSFL